MKDQRRYRQYIRRKRAPNHCVGSKTVLPHEVQILHVLADCSVPLDQGPQY